MSTTADIRLDTPPSENTTSEAEERKTTVPLNDEGWPVIGVHEGVDFDDYKAAPGANKSGLDNVDVCPELYQYDKNNPALDTNATDLGSAFHTLTLEPDLFDQQFVKAEYLEFRTKEAKAWKAEQEAKGLTVLRINSDDPERKPSEWDKVHRMAEKIWANPYAMAIIESSRKEVTMFWIDKATGLLCKGRADCLSDGHFMLADIKTTEDPTYDGFSRSVHKFRYDVQDAFYSDGARQCGERIDGFMFIVIGKTPPFLCACYVLPPEWRKIGRLKYQRNLETMRQCRDRDEWPGLEPIRDLQMPNYAKFISIK